MKTVPPTSPAFWVSCVNSIANMTSPSASSIIWPNAHGRTPVRPCAAAPTPARLDRFSLLPRPLWPQLRLVILGAAGWCLPDEPKERTQPLKMSPASFFPTSSTHHLPPVPAFHTQGAHGMERPPSPMHAVTDNVQPATSMGVQRNGDAHNSAHRRRADVPHRRG